MSVTFVNLLSFYRAVLAENTERVCAVEPIIARRVLLRGLTVQLCVCQVSCASNSYRKSIKNTSFMCKQ